MMEHVERKDRKPINGDPTINVRDLVDDAVHRQDDLRDVNTMYVHMLADLRSDYETKLRLAESARIDAIRSVDISAVQQAAIVQATQAATLAAQVTSSAETLRNQVAAAASASTIALAAEIKPLQEAIADLRRAQYEAQGQKTQIVETTAKGMSSGMWIGVVMSGISLLLSVGVAVAALIVTTSGG